MATSARIGASSAGRPAPWVDALTAYGRALGMAFQIWDDIRDLVCSEEHLGKPAGHDMVEGTYTLPVLRALAVAGVGDDLRALLGRPARPPARDKARDLVLSTSAVTRVGARGPPVGRARRTRPWTCCARRVASAEHLAVLGPGRSPADRRARGP